MTLTHKEMTGPLCSGGSVSGFHGMAKELQMLSYRRETALQGALDLAKSGRLELGETIF